MKFNNLFIILIFTTGFTFTMETSWQNYEKEVVFNELIDAVKKREPHRLHEIVTGEKSISINTVSRTFALKEAAETDNPEMIRLIIEKYKGDPNLRGVYGWTALMTASRSNRLKATQELLKLGAHPELKNEAGFDALDYARFNIELKQNVDTATAILKELNDSLLKKAPVAKL
jgi:ankyrin repeat protein